ncbi:MAG: universal stress protein [Deltaproteobacteria bacterium]|nr:universal stress protein [Deltaproteobacteria bacterium]
MEKMKILLAVDGSETSSLAVKKAGETHGNRAVEVTLLVVLEDVVSYRKIPDNPLYREREADALQLLENAKSILQEYGIEANTKMAMGPVAAEIVRIAEEEGFDAIFMGSRGRRGIKRLLLGSVADEVIRYAHCPVTIVR